MQRIIGGSKMNLSPYLDHFYKQIEKTKRSWKERLFSYPWTPWKKYNETEYMYGIDISKNDKSMRCKAHYEGDILMVDEIKPFTYREYQQLLEQQNRTHKPN
jgi:hypothetical protein